MTVTRFFARLRHDWLVVVGIVLIAAAGSGAYLAHAKPMYDSSAQVFVAAGGSQVSTLSDGLTFTQQIVKSFADLASSPVVVNSAVDSLASDEVDGHEFSVSASAPVDQTTITIDVTSDSPQLASRLANALVSTLKSYVPTVMGTTDRPITITLVEPAQVSTTPSSPQYGLVIFGAIALALALSCAWIALRTALGRTVQSVQDVTELAKLQDVAVFELRGSFDSNAVGLLDSPVTAVVSDVAGAHMDFVGQSLAAFFVRAGSRTLLIDLRRQSNTGTDDVWKVLTRRATLADMTRTDLAGYAVLGAGLRDGKSLGLLRTGALTTLIADARADYDQIVVLIGTGEELVLSAGPVLREASRVIVGGALGSSTRAGLVDVLTLTSSMSGTLPDVVLVPQRVRRHVARSIALRPRRLRRAALAKSPA